MPLESSAWRQLRQRAEAQLSPQFADNVIRAARQTTSGSSSLFGSPWLVSAVTATVCLVGVLFFHEQQIRATSENHLAAWQEISAQTASLEPAP